MPGGQMLADLDERDVDLAGDQREDLLGVRLDAPRAPVSTLRSGSQDPGGAPPLRPFDSCRRCYTEAGRSLAAAQPTVDRGNHARAQVL
jgi:hypothetical protein